MDELLRLQSNICRASIDLPCRPLGSGAGRFRSGAPWRLSYRCSSRPVADYTSRSDFALRRHLISNKPSLQELLAKHSLKLLQFIEITPNYNIAHSNPGFSRSFSLANGTDHSDTNLSRCSLGFVLCKSFGDRICRPGCHQSPVTEDDDSLYLHIDPLRLELHVECNIGLISADLTAPIALIDADCSTANPLSDAASLVTSTSQEAEDGTAADRL